MNNQKGNGLTAINSQPAKDQTEHATHFIADKASQTTAGAAFHAKPCAGIKRRQYRAGGHRARILLGAIHTTKQAGDLPDSEVFSRSEFKDGLSFQGIHGYGAGSAYPQGRQHGCVRVFKPSSTRYRLNTVASGYQSHTGAEPMTNVNRTTTPKTGNTSPLIRQQAIENALNMALFHVRKGDTHRAVAKSIRAASMLKQACTEIQNGGAA